jgi:phosphate transport system substrate-binding protein
MQVSYKATPLIFEVKTRFGKVCLKILIAGLLIGLLSASCAELAPSLRGAGSTFDAPIFSLWFYKYQKEKGVQVLYDSIGSGAGIKRLIARSVDFGASDAYLNQKEEREAEDSGGPILHIPVALGALCIVYNIPNVVMGLKLTSRVIADIFMGNITNWHDPRLAKLNPGVNLPNLGIAVIRRSEESGSTNIFTNYLTKANPLWGSKIGWGKSVAWPLGIGVTGNEGITEAARNTAGAISYVEMSSVAVKRLNFARIQNRFGKFVAPSIDSASKAAAGAFENLPGDFKMMITDAEGPDSYPICGFSWMLVFRKASNRENRKAMVDLLNWVMDNHEQCARLYYVPFPKKLIAKIKVKINTIQ